MDNPRSSLPTWRAILFASVVLVSRTHAATISVNSTSDTSGNTSICTLRDAITAANTNGVAGGCAAGEPGLDTIDFRFPRILCLATPCVIELTSALPTVTEDLTLDGGFFRPTIVRVVVTQFPVLDLGSITADIRNVVLSGGNIQGSGGAIKMNATSLSVTNVTFTSNRASSGGGAIFVYIGSSLRVVDSMFGNNRGLRGGAIACLGAQRVREQVLG